MIVLATGSREWRDPKPIRARLVELPRGTIIRHGGARGLDRLVDAIAGGLGFRVEEYPAVWRTPAGRFDRSAGARRSIAMLDDEPPPELVLAWQLDYSSGTQITVDAAVERGIRVELESVETLIRSTARIGIRTVERALRITPELDEAEPRYYVSIRNRSYYSRHEVPIEAARRHYAHLRRELARQVAARRGTGPPTTRGVDGPIRSSGVRSSQD